MELLIGCGARKAKMMKSDASPDWKELITLDINPDHKPDVVHDLNVLPLPFAEGIFDEIHAYEVLEHIGHLGDFRSFLDLFSEFWRIMAPNGYLCGTSPAKTSPWLWGDPGHTREISAETLTFVNQRMYTEQIGFGPMSDYRHWYKADFEAQYFKTEGDAFIYVLRAMKPSRISI